MPVKLGVNIDPLVILKNSGEGSCLDLVQAAQACLLAGAGKVTVTCGDKLAAGDLAALEKGLKTRLEVRVSSLPEHVKKVMKVKPQTVCLFPAGKSFGKEADTAKIVAGFNKAGTAVSLFVEPTADAVRLAHKIGAKCVELNTRPYMATASPVARQEILEDLEVAALMAQELGLDVHAGGWLDYGTAGSIADVRGIERLNIGFSIIARSVFVGIPKAVEEMQNLL